MTDINSANLNTLDLLDAKLSDMSDLPEWVVFPAGVYKVKPSVKIERKANQKTKVMETVITVNAKCIEVKEVQDATQPRVAVDSETSTRYTWENEYGQGGLKKLLAPIAAITKLDSVKKLLDVLDSADSVLIVMDTRDSTNAQTNKTTTYQVFADLIVD